MQRRVPPLQEALNKVGFEHTATKVTAINCFLRIEQVFGSPFVAAFLSRVGKMQVCQNLAYRAKRRRNICIFFAPLVLDGGGAEEKFFRIGKLIFMNFTNTLLGSFRPFSTLTFWPPTSVFAEILTL